MGTKGITQPTPPAPQISYHLYIKKDLFSKGYMKTRITHCFYIAENVQAHTDTQTQAREQGVRREYITHIYIKEKSLFFSALPLGGITNELLQSLPWFEAFGTV